MPTVGITLARRGRGGNRVTALRWARCLRRLGWTTVLTRAEGAGDVDLLVALHAGRSRDAIERWRRLRPGRPLVVAATGTDLYRDLPRGGPAADAVRAGFAAADRIVVLQEDALARLPGSLRDRARVVHQSLPAPARRPAPRTDRFEVCVLANLRAVKDPRLPAAASRLLPGGSRIAVLHLGAALDADLRAWAEAESASNPRWSWRGDRPRGEALCTLASARLCVCPSRAEGGANVVTESLALGVPVLATEVSGSVGLLGVDHPGLFPVGDARALAGLLERAEQDPGFLRALAEHGRRRAWIADPARELDAWRALLEELFPAGLPR